MTVPPALLSHESTEHYTPQYILGAVIACMGAIHLDPASNSHEIPNVPAARNRSETKGMCCESVYRTPAPTNNEPLRNICEEKESDLNATIWKFQIVPRKVLERKIEGCGGNFTGAGRIGWHRNRDAGPNGKTIPADEVSHGKTKSEQIETVIGRENNRKI